MSIHLNIIEGPRVAHSFGGFLTRKKLAKLLDQYFSPNNTCEEVAVGTVYSISSGTTTYTSSK